MGAEVWAEPGIRAQDKPSRHPGFSKSPEDEGQ